MKTRVRSGAVMGIDGCAVTVEVDVSRGLPGFHLVGLPNAAVKESRERVLAALRHSGYRFPAGRVTVNLAPADIRKEGAAYDLAIALGVIAAQRRFEDSRSATDAVVVGELSLFGEVRAVRGLLAIALAAAVRGERRVVVPASQAWEAALVTGIDVVAVRTLAEAADWLFRGRRPDTFTGPAAPPRRRSAAGLDGGDESSGAPAAAIDGRGDAFLTTLKGQDLARRAIVIAAAGGHNLLLIGPPGAGKTRLARGLAWLLPPLDAGAALEVTRIHSAAGVLAAVGLVKEAPFRAPHHTITRAGLVGGGSALLPGEATLAHRGVLFLDELAEFAPPVLDALREPLDEGWITVVRVAGRRCFPARFQLVGAMNPCRCGYLGSRRRACRCSLALRRRYRQRLSGPFLDRFDLFVEMVEPQTALLGSGGAAERGNSWRDGPAAAAIGAVRSQRPRRWAAPPEATLAERVASYGLVDNAAEHLDGVRRRLGLSLRAVLRCARVAATIAALDGQSRVERAAVDEALEFRRECVAALDPLED